MCGVNGYYLKEINNIKEINLNEANNKLSHRGPDNKGVYYAKKKLLGLGHTRLSIQDISSKGNQPMISECKRFVTVFNGEIYNFKEIKKFLFNKSKNFSLSSRSDTEILLKYYSYCDKNNKSIKYFFSKLIGIFSLAIWDNKLNKLVLARDSFGVKPLYYSYNKKGIFFSSEIKSLSEFGIDFKELDYQSINHYLSYIWCPGRGTPVKNIKKVSPGEVLIVEKGEITNSFYWYTHPYFKKRKIINSQYDCIKKTEKLLRKAVQKQLVSDVPLGAFLSGGLDSSSIVAFAKELIPDIKCFTIKTKESLKNDGFVDDYNYACKVANYLKVPLETVEVYTNALVDNLEKMVYQLDEPIADPASINVLFISRLAKESGIKVLLSGAGGDDLFSGYRRHRALGSEFVWTFLPMRIKNLIKKYSTNLQTKNIIERRLKRVFSGANLNRDERIINYFRWNSQNDLINIYSDDFRKQLKNINQNDPLMNYLESIPEDLPNLDRMLSLEQRFFLTDHNLLYTDKMSMQEGVEVRVPFLDHDLVNFATQVPVKFKNRRGELKWVLKKTMEPYLPKEIIYRPKTGFGVPLRKWIKDELKEWVREVLSFESIKRRGLFNPYAVQKLLQDNEDNKVDAGYTILSLVCIEIWCKKFQI